MKPTAISPELALVDPDLAEAARQRLPTRPPKAIAAERARAAMSSAAPPRPSGLRPARVLRVAAVLAATVCVGYATAWALVTQTSLVGEAGRHTAPRAVPAVGDAAPATQPGTQGRPSASTTPADAGRPAAPSRHDTPATPATTAQNRTPATPATTAVAPRTPAPPAHPRVAAAPAVRIVWRPVAGATYYDLILWYRHQRVLDLWPQSAHAVVPRAWTRAGTRRSLAPGLYQWFVYAGLGPRSAHRFGALAGSGSFVVGAS